MTARKRSFSERNSETYSANLYCRTLSWHYVHLRKGSPTNQTALTFSSRILSPGALQPRKHTHGHSSSFNFHNRRVKHEQVQHE
ncbi:hypothetical protein BU25DRAFT_167764 [Macroventuria anomochaeta]|uniref:Uncharacterized protein n=1 Tax=Macroventuria anomochaeta TaxID=301207 RepID=A0ACB6RQ49_9PLEO|nr:uncharacterized protein BU25DRAFT_167764 [Macroventuria anomochaeta]KAF2623837.1 hypothetical protein BU25DRAFT_167764 [Macroventuria anomochaeta]